MATSIIRAGECKPFQLQKAAIFGDIQDRNHVLKPKFKCEKISATVGDMTGSDMKYGKENGNEWRHTHHNRGV